MNAYGRSWTTAQTAALTVYPEGDALIKFTWADGAFLVQSYPSSDAAIEALARLGFRKNTSQ